MEILLVTNNKDHLNSLEKFFKKKNILLKPVSLNQDEEDNSKTTFIKNGLKAFETFKKPLIVINSNLDEEILIYVDQYGYLVYEKNIYEKIFNFLKKRKVARGITFIDDKVLLLKRVRRDGEKILNYYAIPGGGVEKDETKEEACLREIEEETSIKASINTYLDFEEYNEGVCYYFLTNYLSGIPCLGGEEKIKNFPDNSYEVKLVALKELDNIMIYGIGIDMIKKAYKRYKV